MSYYLKVNFISNVKQDEVYDYIRKEIEYQKENMQKKIDKNIENVIMHFDIPDIKEIRKFYTKFGFILQSNFIFEVIYYPKYNLLGFIGDVENGNKIEFQNSTDQNYDFDYYKGIDYIQDIVDKYKHISEKELLKIYIEDNKNSNDYNFEYDRRTYCYKEIMERLDIESYLYKIEDFIKKHKFLRINVIETRDDEFNFHTCIRKSIKDWYDKNPEWT